MRLIWRIILRITLLLLIIMPLWGFFFYRAMINEVNDETDDNLELYAEQIIRRYLSGEEQLSPINNMTNNTHSIEKVASSEFSEEYSYHNEMVYIPAKGETEPARVLRMTFTDADNNLLLLTVKTPTIESEDLAQSILHCIAILFFGLLIIIVIIVWVVLKQNMKPLKRLLEWIDHYRLGEEAAPLKNSTSISEFRRLNDAAIEFAARNEKLFQQQKQFIGNASHEIQTPIAICRNRMEMLCEMDLNEAQMTEVMKTRKTLEYISRLNKSLLFLTKIENRQFGELEQVNIREIIVRCVEDYSEIYGYKNIEVTISEGNEPMIYRMNRTLAVTLVSNLIRNAFIHNNENGTVAITSTGNQLTITNSGETNPLDKNHIFEPFSHSTQKESSTGLGLPIVKSITEYYGFRIDYNYCNGKHQFSINFRFIS